MQDVKYLGNTVTMEQAVTDLGSFNDELKKLELNGTTYNSYQDTLQLPQT